MSTAPTNFKLKYVPIAADNHDATTCSAPTVLDLAKEFPGRKIVVTGAPGAFTPTCTGNHIPDFLTHIKEFKAKGVDRVIVLTANDPFVLAAWGKNLGYLDEENYFIFVSDPNAEFSKALGGEDYVADMTKAGMGIRTGRYAAIINDTKVEYLANEADLGYSESSSANTILERL